jgi:hypothetical protein
LRISLIFFWAGAGRLTGAGDENGQVGTWLGQARQFSQNYDKWLILAHFLAHMSHEHMGHGNGGLGEYHFTSPEM